MGRENWVFFSAGTAATLSRQTRWGNRRWQRLASRDTLDGWVSERKFFVCLVAMARPNALRGVSRPAIPERLRAVKRKPTLDFTAGLCLHHFLLTGEYLYATIA